MLDDVYDQDGGVLDMTGQYYLWAVLEQRQVLNRFAFQGSSFALLSIIPTYANRACKRDSRGMRDPAVGYTILYHPPA
jgi:hypothetical protein